MYISASGDFRELCIRHGGKIAMTTIEKLLLVLSDGNWHSTEELVQEVGHRFSATVHVAKQRGDRIEKRRVDRNQFEYRLVMTAKV
jgi:hypothetical protein